MVRLVLWLLGMDDIRKKVCQLTLKLQSQRHLPLWKLANENVIYSAAVGEKPSWGPRSKILLRFFSFAYRMKISDVLIFVFGIYRATLLWLAMGKNGEKSKFERIFVGFGASSEEYLWSDYLRRSGKPTLRISQITGEKMSQIGRPSLVSIILILLQNSCGYTSKLKKTTQEVSGNIIDFLTVCALNIGVYSFYRAFWNRAKKNGLQEIAFLAPDIPAFASIDEGIRTIYLQHGLMALSILIPKFSRIETLTLEEEKYLKAFCKDIEIIRSTKKLKENNSVKNNTLMVLSLNVSITERLNAAETIIRWAIQAGLKVVIRPTARVTKDNLAFLKQQLPQVELDDFMLPLEVSLEKWNPKLVVAWTSTGLATALDEGCLPISLCDPEIKDSRWSLIYPLMNRVLFWPRDKFVLESAIHRESVYGEQIMKLQNIECSYEQI